MGYSLVRECPSCHALNRIPANHLADTGRCGKCKQPLTPVAAPLDVDSSTSFDDIVTSSRVPILVDFWADWCGPCKVAAPHVQQLAERLAGKALVLKVDTEKNPDLAARYEVRGIPNFVVFKDGQKRLQRAGVSDSREMERWLTQA
jgi:thioredoxin 2